MREIKFRAWDKMTGKYLYSGVDYAIAVMELKFPEVDDAPPMGYGSTEQERFDIEQYTGLHDKNGREIYEGDIVHFDLQDFNGEDHLYTLPVAFVVDMFGFPYKSEPSDPEPDCCISLGEVVANDDGIEVIGNIHENTELLK